MLRVRKARKSHPACSETVKIRFATEDEAIAAMLKLLRIPGARR